jgi:hypothetical protein
VILFWGSFKIFARAGTNILVSQRFPLHTIAIPDDKGRFFN